MPPKKEPVGSTANLPPMVDIEQAEESRAVDIDEMFGASEDADDETPPAEAGASPGAADAGAGAGAVEGSSPAPDTQTPPVEGAAPDQTATQGDGTPSAPSAQPQTPAPAAAPPPVAPVDAEKLRLQSLEAQVEALQAELGRARANPPAQPGATPAGGGTAQPDDLPRYALSLPPQVLAALTSDDEQQFSAGVTTMLNSLATIVHHNVRLEMRQAFAGLMNSAREQDSQTQTATAVQSAREDYYKAFPAHKDPLILPLIQAESQAMSAQFPNLAWSDDFRNALGQRVEARLAQLRGQGNGGQPPAAPAASIPAGPRPNESLGGELTGGDLIADTFS